MAAGQAEAWPSGNAAGTALMPAVSRQQQKWAFAAKGEAWARAHHFDVLSTARKARRKRHVRKK